MSQDYTIFKNFETCPHAGSTTLDVNDPFNAETTFDPHRCSLSHGFSYMNNQLVNFFKFVELNKKYQIEQHNLCST